jgi:hypothetical protein
LAHSPLRGHHPRHPKNVSVIGLGVEVVEEDVHHVHEVLQEVEEEKRSDGSSLFNKRKGITEPSHHTADLSAYEKRSEDPVAARVTCSLVVLWSPRPLALRAWAATVTRARRTRALCACAPRLNRRPPRNTRSDCSLIPPMNPSSVI